MTEKIIAFDEQVKYEQKCRFVERALRSAQNRLRDTRLLQSIYKADFSNTISELEKEVMEKHEEFMAVVFPENT